MEDKTMEVDLKERTLADIDGRILGLQIQLDRMNETIEQGYEIGGHIVYVPDEKKSVAEIKRLKSARKRVVKDLDPLPKYNWKRSS